MHIKRFITKYSHLDVLDLCTQFPLMLMDLHLQNPVHQSSTHEYCKHIGTWINSTQINPLLFLIVYVNLGLTFLRTKNLT